MHIYPADLIETLELYCLYPLEKLKCLTFSSIVTAKDWKIMKDKLPNLKEVHFKMLHYNVRRIILNNIVLVGGESRTLSGQ